MCYNVYVIKTKGVIKIMLNEIEKEKLKAVCELYTFEDRIKLCDEYDYNRLAKVTKFNEITKKLGNNEQLDEREQQSLIEALNWCLDKMKVDKFMSEFYGRLMVKIKE